MQRNQVICFGEALIDLLPEQNGQPLKDVPSFQRNPGGAPANVAAAVAKLGGQARFVGMVGEDAFGHFLKDTLDDLHIDTTYFQFSTEAHTALAFVSLKENGERDFMFYRSPSADMLVEASHIKDKIFDDGLIFHFGSVLQASEPSRSATTMAIEKAKQQGLLIHYDPNVRLPLWQNPEEAKELILATLPLADIVKISDEELLFLTGEEDIQSAAKKLFLHSEAQLLLVTLGEKGCFYMTPTISGKVSGFPVVTIDTTGAGDGFVGGFLTYLAEFLQSPRGLYSLLTEPRELEKCLRTANAIGALTTTKRGAISALPSKSEVEQFLKASKD